MSTILRFVSGEHKNAHDIIMEANKREFAKRVATGKSAEDNIVKINKAIGNDLFEGDIAISKEELKTFYGTEKGNGKRVVINDRRYTWRTRIIPYRFDASISGCKLFVSIPLVQSRHVKQRFLGNYHAL